MRAVDLFCGAGGLGLGLVRAGAELVLSADSWPAALAVHSANLPGDAVPLDLSDEAGAAAEILSRVGRPDLVAGGPPCQDASPAGKRVEGERSGLTASFARIAVRLGPDWTVMENVPAARKTRSWSEAREILRAAGYGVTEAVLDASRHGAPQARQRAFMVGGRGADDGALAGSLEAGASEEPTTLRAYAAATGWGLPFDHYYRHPRTYGRRGVFSADEPAPTMRGVNRPVPATYRRHPGDTADPRTVRRLTIAERALIQTFPPDWDWGTHRSAAVVEQLVGNAVPPRLAEHVARAVMGYAARRRGPTPQTGAKIPQKGGIQGAVAVGGGGRTREL